MILDASLILATAWAPTATGTTYPAYTLDQGFAADWGMGTDWSLFVTTVTSFSTGSSPTLQLQQQAHVPLASTGSVHKQQHTTVCCGICISTATATSTAANIHFI